MLLHALANKSISLPETGAESFRRLLSSCIHLASCEYQLHQFIVTRTSKGILCSGQGCMHERLKSIS